MNKGLLKQLNKELKQNSYYKRVKSGKCFFGVSMKYELKLNADEHSGLLHIDANGDLKQTTLEHGNHLIDSGECFGIQSTIIKNLKQTDDYTYAIRIDDLEIIPSENGGNCLHIKACGLMPQWLDNEDKCLHMVYEAAAGSIAQMICDIIENTTNISISSMKNSWDCQGFALSDRSEMMKQIPQGV